MIFWVRGTNAWCFSLILGIKGDAISLSKSEISYFIWGLGKSSPILLIFEKSVGMARFLSVF